MKDNGLVDFHLHLFSRVYFETLAALSPQPGSVPERLAEVERRLSIQIPPPDLRAHVERWLAEFDLHGVERAAAFASVPEEIPALAQARELSGGRLVPFALVQPAKPESAGRVEALLAQQGFGGVLLFPALHHYRVSDPACAALFQTLNRQRAVAFVHCGELIVKLRDFLGIARTQDARFADPTDVAPVALANPDATFVIPHFGGGRFEETLALGARCPNVVVDTSSSNSWAAAAGLDLKQVFARALSVFGHERILFGTDSTTFPKGWQRARLDEQRAVLEELEVTAAGRAAILGGNARRILARRC